MLAVIFAAMGAALMIFYVKRFEEEASGGERIRVLVAVKPLDKGAVIDEESVSVREIPIAYVEDRFIKAVERSKIIGLKLGNKIEAQQTLLWTDLAIASDERRDLSALVQPGSRAVSIRASRGDKSYSMIRPGDYVDVVANMPADNDREKKTAFVLMQRVLVLAVGLETAPEAIAAASKDGPMREMVLTLSVRLEDGQLLALAQDKGELLVALRNPGDQRIDEGIPEITSSALGDRNTLLKFQKARKSGPIKLEAK